MGDSASPRANSDIREILARAQESTRGVRIRCETANEALVLRRRLNSERVRDRKLSETMYEQGHPAFGCSDFDAFSFNIVNQTVVEIIPITASRYDIEEI